MDFIQKRVQLFLHSCNTTAIEDVESGSLAEFGGLQKNVERGDWLTLTPGWLDWPVLKEEGLRKPDIHRIGARPSCGGGGRDAVFNNRVDPQLRIVERLGEMTAAASLENLCCPWEADDR